MAAGGVLTATGQSLVRRGGAMREAQAYRGDFGGGGGRGGPLVLAYLLIQPGAQPASRLVGASGAHAGRLHGGAAQLEQTYTHAPDALQLGKGLTLEALARRTGGGGAEARTREGLVADEALGVLVPALKKSQRRTGNMRARRIRAAFAAVESTYALSSSF